MKPLVWLASYPKSGNTWVRAFFANLLSDDSRPVHINDIDGNTIASARKPFDELLGIDSHDLDHDEIDLLRPQVYEWSARFSDAPRVRKVHDAFSRLGNGKNLFPCSVTDRAIYIVRNPLDVCVSYAAHGGDVDLEKTIERMTNSQANIAGSESKPSPQLRQRLGTWSEHVESWMTGPPFPVLAVRYEDLCSAPHETFGRIARFLGLPKNNVEIEAAVRCCTFDVLKEMEIRDGFKERPSRSKKFFRSGGVGGWRDVLTDRQVERILAENREGLERFAYLSDSGDPVF